MLLDLRSKTAVPVMMVLILAVGYLDYLYGFQLSLFPLYIFPVATIAWKKGLRPALATSAVACVVITLKNVYGESFAKEVFRDWDIVSKVLILCLIAWSIAKIRELATATSMANMKLNSAVMELMQAREQLLQSNELLEKRVADRTRELSATIGHLEAEIAERIRLGQELETECRERSRVEAELRDNELLLMQQSRMAAMGEMIGNIAHQWRQPLNVLGLIVQELSLTYSMGGFSLEYLDAQVAKITATLQHMSHTINVFRDFFRPDKERADFRVSEAIAKTLFLLEGSLREAGIAAEVAATCDPVLHGYPNEFSQVLLNIVANARDAFAGGKVEARRVVITVAADDGKTVVTIADNAGGIAEGVLDRIFDPYFTTKSAEQGTGVGLHMSRIIIEQHLGGTLTARNVGAGAEFRIVI